MLKHLDLRRAEQDTHGNWITTSDAARLARITYSSDASPHSMQQLLPFALADSVRDGTRVEIQLTRSGEYLVHVEVLAGLNLMATYYSDSAFENPLAALTASEIDFSRSKAGMVDEQARCASSLDPGALPPGLPYNGTFSVRWSGFIRPAVGQQLYVANLSVVGADERMRLWVDGNLLVDQWSSLTVPKSSATVWFTTPGGYYQLKMEYKQEFGSSGTTLSWSGAPYTLARFKGLPISPLSLTVVTGPVDITRSKLYGGALTLATACMSAHFTVMARDAFGNAAKIDHSERHKWEIFVIPARFTGHHVASLSKAGHAATGDVSCSVGAHGCVVQYRTTASGRYVVLVRVSTSDGMQHLLGSPSEVLVLHGAISVRLSQARGRGLTLSTAGKNAEFTILARDCAGTVVATPTSAISLYHFAMYDGAGQKAEAHFSSTVSGVNVLVTITCFSSGQYSLSINTPAGSLRGSPYVFFCAAAEPSSTSIVLGAGLTLATAGVESRFAIILRDRFNNSADSYACALQMVRDVSKGGINESNAVPLLAQTGSCKIQWLSTSSGIYSLHVGYMKEGALSSTYYSGHSFTVPILSLPSVGINISGTNSTTFSPVYPNRSFGVRWMGFIKPTVPAYSFVTALASSQDRIRVWIDNSLLVDQWSSLAGTEAFATVSFGLPAMYHGITVEYKRNASGTDWGATLEWRQSSTLLAVPISYQAFTHIALPFAATVLSDQIAGPSSEARGSALTIMTAGSAASFLVLGRDQYGNIATSQNLRVQVSVGTNPTPIQVLSTQMLRSGQWNVTISGTTQSGTFALDVGIFESHGLWATYYSDTRFRTTAAVRIDRGINFAWGLSSPETGVPNEYFSVKWRGFISARHSEPYLLYLYGAVDPDIWREAPDCAKYVVGTGARDLRNNSVVALSTSHQVLNLCEKAGVREYGMWERSFDFDTRYMYRLEVDYKATVGEAGCKLRWSSAHQMPDFVSPEFLHRFSLFRGSPSTVNVVERKGDNRARCLTTGPAFTIGTSGLSSSITVMCRDEYGNDLLSREDMVLHIRNKNAFVASTYLPLSAKNTSHVLQYLLTRSARYHLDVFNFRKGFLSATYYEAAIFHPSYARKSVEVALSPKHLQGDNNGHGLQRPFGVRWAGFLHIDPTQISKILINLPNTDERIKMWVDTVLLVDQWTSLAHHNITTLLSSPLGDSVHEFRLQYSSSSIGEASMNLAWAPGALSQAQIERNAFLAAQSATGRNSDLFETDGMLLQIEPAAFCASSSRIFGSGLTYGIVGRASTFTIVNVDQYGNLLTKSRALTPPKLLVYNTSPALLLQSSTIKSEVDGTLAVSYEIGSSVPGSYQQTGHLYLKTGLKASLSSSHSMVEGVVVDLSTDFSISADGVPTLLPAAFNTSFTVRWTGFIRASLPQTYTLFAEVTEADERVKLWIDNTLIVDQWSSLDNMKPLGTVVYSVPGYYDIMIEYKQSSGASGFRLKGSGIVAHENGIPWTNPLAMPYVLPLSDLFHGLLIGNKTFNLSISHGKPNSSRTMLSGSFLTLTTAGVSSAFTIDVRDAAGSSVVVTNASGPEVLGVLQLFGPFQDDKDRHEYQLRRQISWLGDVVNQSRTFSFILTLSGQYLSALSFYSRGGLAATYWDNMHQGFLTDISASTRIDPVLEFRWSKSNPIISDGLASVNAYASVMWDGFVLSDYSEKYTLILTLEADVLRRDGRYCAFCHDMAQVFVNGELQVTTDKSVLTVKEGLVREHYSTVAFAKGMLQHLRVVMRHYEGDVQLKLEWTSVSTPRAVIPSSRLYHLTDVLNLGPLRMLVRSGVRSAASSSVQTPHGHMTAGTQKEFTIKSFDVFGNPAQPLGDGAGVTALFVRAALPESISAPANISSVVGTNEETACLTITQAAVTEIHALFLHPGGLRAVYNFSNSSTEHLISRVDEVINFSSSLSSTFNVASIAANRSFSVQWSGFVQAPADTSYTIIAAVTGVGDRVKLWVDNKLMVNQWSSLQRLEPSATVYFGRNDAYYEVMLEYKQTAAQRGATWGSRLSWHSQSWSQPRVIDSQYLWYGAHIGGSPFKGMTVADVVSIASTASGTGLTLASSGVVGAFTIRSTDRFGNRAGFDVSPFSPHLSCNASSPLTPNRKVLEDGIEAITYVTSFSQSVCKLGILLHGQHHIQGSPWMLVTRLGPTSASLSTLVREYLPTVMTAGVHVHLSIQSRDVFGELKPALGDNFIASFYAPLHSKPAHVFSFNASMVGASEYGAQMAVTLSGNYSVHIGKLLAQGAGFQAQFFGQPALQMLLAESVASPNFVGYPHPLIGEGRSFSVRWKGYVHLPQEHSCALYLRLAAVQDRVRMWINSALVIDQWTSLASLLLSASVTTLPNEVDSFRHVQIEFTHPYGHPSLSLQWAAGNSSLSEIPDEKMHAGLEHISSSPFRWTLIPAAAVNLASTGHGLSLGTVGVKSQFTVVSADQYGNLRNKDDGILVFLSSTNVSGDLFSRPETVVSRSGARSTVLYRAPTSAGYHYMYAFVANPGGVMATYYSDANMSDPKDHAQVSRIDFSGSNTKPSESLGFNVSWGVRWSGFVRPSLAQVYTMYTVLAGEDERVKLWIDNVLMIDQWASLAGTLPSCTVMFSIIGGFYPVSMEYKQLSGANYGAALTWSQASHIPREAITKFWWDGGIINSPFRVLVLTGGGGSGLTDTSESVRGFIGNVVNNTYKAGSLISYRLQTQDNFGNDLSFDCANMPGDFCRQIPFSIFLEELSPPSETRMHMKPQRLFQDGYAYYRFIPTVSGTYDLHVHLMRQNAVGMRSFRPYAASFDIVSSFKTVVSTDLEACPTQTNFHFSGFLFVEQTGLMMFQLRATILAQFYIEGQQIVSFSSGRAGEARGEVFLSSERPYEFSLQNQACSVDHKPAEILWRFDHDAPFAPIPQSRLFYKADELSQNRFTIKIEPSQFCSSCSHAEGSGLTLAIASMQASFTIFAKDQYCNMLIDPVQDTIVGRILRDGSAVQFLQPEGASVDARLSVPYTTEYPHGIYDLYLSHAAAGVWMRIEANSTSGRVKRKNISVPTVDFSASGLLGLPDFTLTVNSSFSVRWIGFIQPAVGQQYTMYVSVAQPHGRIKLWVDGKLLVDQWSSLQSTEPSGTIILGQVPGYYHVVMEYKQIGGIFGAQLKWQSQSIAKSVISSDYLWTLSDIHHSMLRIQTMWNKSTAYSEIQNIPAPTSLLTVSGGECITVVGFGFNTSAQIYTCVFTGKEFSAALPATAFNSTAMVCHTPPWYSVGMNSQIDFTLRVHDVVLPNWAQLTTQFNVQGLLLSIKPRKSTALGVANITISALGLTSRSPRKCVFEGSSDNFAGTRVMVQDSSTTLSLGSSIATCFTPVWGQNRSATDDTLWYRPTRITNGLAATYYLMTNFSAASKTTISFEVDFSKAFGSSLLQGGITGGSQVPRSVTSGSLSIRWAGFIRPQLAVTYTVKVGVHDFDERVKMWIDNALIVDQWTSLRSTEGSATWGFANANSFYDIRIEYQQQTGSMGLQLQWKRDAEAFVAVPSTRLFLPPGGWGQTSLSLVEGIHGLVATYYGSSSFHSALFSKVDDAVRQQQIDISPKRSVYSVRWSGFIQPSMAQQYTMYASLAQTDQRVKMWVDNKLIVDQWSSLVGTQAQGTLVFGAAFARYKIVIEYKQRGPAPTGATLSWNTGAQLVSVIPPGSLFMKSSTEDEKHLTAGSTRFIFSGWFTLSQFLLFHRVYVAVVLRTRTHLLIEF
jgi:hypothetical protein